MNLLSLLQQIETTDIQTALTYVIGVVLVFSATTVGTIWFTRDLSSLNRSGLESHT